MTLVEETHATRLVGTAGLGATDWGRSPGLAIHSYGALPRKQPVEAHVSSHVKTQPATPTISTYRDLEVVRVEVVITCPVWVCVRDDFCGPCYNFSLPGILCFVFLFPLRICKQR